MDISTKRSIMHPKDPRVIRFAPSLIGPLHPPLSLVPLPSQHSQAIVLTTSVARPLLKVSTCETHALL